MVDPLDDLVALRALLESLALAAGAEILAVRRAGVAVTLKADSSPVTEADRRAETIILTGLRRAFPGLTMIGEEEMAAGSAPRRVGDRFFLVDPLDGTKEFLRGGDDFTVNIALIENGVPVAGIVHAPARGTLWSAVGGVAEKADLRDGAVAERRRIAVARPPAVLRVVASRSHRTAPTEAFIAGLPAAECLAIGSSLKFCLIAEGAADLYPRFGRTMEWDTAAGDAVLRAAGGVTLDGDGRPLAYGKQGGGFANGDFIAGSRAAAEALGR